MSIDHTGLSGDEFSAATDESSAVMTEPPVTNVTTFRNICNWSVECDDITFDSSKLLKVRAWPNRVLNDWSHLPPLDPSEDEIHSSFYSPVSRGTWVGVTFENAHYYNAHNGLSREPDFHGDTSAYRLVTGSSLRIGRVVARLHNSVNANYLRLNVMTHKDQDGICQANLVPSTNVFFAPEFCGIEAKSDKDRWTETRGLIIRHLQDVLRKVGGARGHNTRAGGSVYESSSLEPSSRTSLNEPDFPARAKPPIPSILSSLSVPQQSPYGSPRESWPLNSVRALLNPGVPNELRNPSTLASKITSLWPDMPPVATQTADLLLRCFDRVPQFKPNISCLELLLSEFFSAAESLDRLPLSDSTDDKEQQKTLLLSVLDMFATTDGNFR